MAPKRIRSCKGDTLPEFKLALERSRCLDVTPGVRLSDAASVAAFASEHFGCEPVERMIAFFFNSNNEVLGIQVVGVGGIDQAPVDPRVLFSAAILCGATAIILVHNHPSGNAEPSAADVALTRQLQQSARLLLIRLLDHIVIARGGKYVSMAMQGQLSFNGALGDFGDEEIEYNSTPQPLRGSEDFAGEEREDVSTQCDVGYHDRCIEGGCPCACHRACAYPRSPAMRRAEREDLGALLDPAPVVRRRR